MSECAVVDPVIVVTLSDGTDDTPLSIGPDCAPVPIDPDDEDAGLTQAGLWWTALAWPDQPLRYEYAPTSRYIAGQRLRSAVRDLASLPLSVVCQSTTTDGVLTLMALVDSALAAYPTHVRIDYDGVSVGRWPCMPTTTSWGAITPQRAGLFIAEGGIVIPVNPPPVEVP